MTARRAFILVLLCSMLATPASADHGAEPMTAPFASSSGSYRCSPGLGSSCSGGGDDDVVFDWRTGRLFADFVLTSPADGRLPGRGWARADLTVGASHKVSEPLTGSLEFEVTVHVDRAEAARQGSILNESLRSHIEYDAWARLGASARMRFGSSWTWADTKLVSSLDDAPAYREDEDVVFTLRLPNCNDPDGFPPAWFDIDVFLAASAALDNIADVPDTGTVRAMADVTLEEIRVRHIDAVPCDY